MKIFTGKYLTILVAILAAFGASAQGNRIPTAKCSISQTGGGSGYWQVGATNFNDPGGQFTAEDIAEGDYLFFSDSGTPYSLLVDTIVSASGSNATIRVSNVGVTGISSVPTTSSSFVSRRTVNYGLFPWVSNIPGNENQLQNEYLVYLIDSLLSISGGGGSGSIQWRDEGVNTGTAGQSDKYNVTGKGGNVVVSGDVATIAVPHQFSFHNGGGFPSSYFPYGTPQDSFPVWRQYLGSLAMRKSPANQPQGSDNGLNVYDNYKFTETDLDTLHFDCASYNKARMDFEDVDVFVAIPQNFNSNFNSETFVLEFRNNSNVDSHYVRFDSTFFKVFSFQEYFQPMPPILISGGGTIRTVVFRQEYWAEGARWICDVSTGTLNGVTDLVNGLDISVSNNKVQVAPDINELSTTTIASGDLLSVADVSDGNNPKKITVNDIVSLVPAPSYPVTGVDDQANGHDLTMFGTLVRSAPDINELTTVSPATGDLVMIGDVSDGNNPKKVTIGNLMSGNEYAAVLSQATNAAGQYVISHSFGAAPIKFASLMFEDTVLRPLISIHTTATGSVTFQATDPTTGNPMVIPNRTIRVLIKI